jgi:hypothetical protein
MSIFYFLGGTTLSHFFGVRFLEKELKYFGDAHAN